MHAAPFAPLSPLSSESENLHSVALFTAHLSPRTSGFPERNRSPMATPRLGGEGFLRFCHRLESCKLTFPPPRSLSVTLLAVIPTALAFGLQCFCKKTPLMDSTGISLGMHSIMFKMTLLSMGLLLRPDSASRVGPSPEGDAVWRGKTVLT